MEVFLNLFIHKIYNMNPLFLSSSEFAKLKFRLVTIDYLHPEKGIIQLVGKITQVFLADGPLNEVGTFDFEVSPQSSAESNYADLLIPSNFTVLEVLKISIL